MQSSGSALSIMHSGGRNKGGRISDNKRRDLKLKGCICGLFHESTPQWGLNSNKHLF